MARIGGPTPEQLAGYHEWIESLTPNVRSVAERFQPWELYRLKSTGQRVTVSSFSEEMDGKVTLTVFARQVFGIDPDDLELCELPDKGEVVGTLLTEAKDIEAFVDLQKARRAALNN